MPEEIGFRESIQSRIWLPALLSAGFFFFDGQDGQDGRDGQDEKMTALTGMGSTGFTGFTGLIKEWMANSLT